jgi:ferredoxin
MCEFCHKHGEGKKWYLQAKNYSEDLLDDLRRRNFITDFFRDPQSLGDSIKKIEKLDDAPRFVKRIMSPRISNKMKKIHYGQVVPIEDIDHIFEFVSSVIRVACICRHVSTGSEQRYCYGVSIAPKNSKFFEIVRSIDASYLTGPGTAGLEDMSRDNALAAMRDHEHDGLCHTVWTFVTPFIGGICNCDRSDCLAMQMTLKHEVPILFRAEYIAKINRDLCNGCRECMRQCQFGAVRFSVAQGKASIDPKHCYGCGICRATCQNEAISLDSRLNFPTAAKIW